MEEKTLTLFALNANIICQTGKTDWFQHKSVFKKEIESFTLVFFDTAGEDLNDEDTMSTVNKYICKSAGIIFLLDPMQIPDVVSQLDEKEVQAASGSGGAGVGSEADDIITRVSNLIRNDKGMTETEKIDIPVAAVFSKFDAVVPIVPEGSVILETSPHCRKGYFDIKDFNNVNGEISSLLSEWNGEAFTSQLETNYKQYAYFAVSTLGLNNNPEGNKIQTPRPHRIEDPLLWIFSKYDIIKKK